MKIKKFQFNILMSEENRNKITLLVKKFKINSEESKEDFVLKAVELLVKKREEELKNIK